MYHFEVGSNHSKLCQGQCMPATYVCILPGRLQGPPENVQTPSQRLVLALEQWNAFYLPTVTPQ